MSNGFKQPRPAVRWPWLLLLLGAAAVGLWWYMGGSGGAPRRLPKLSLNVILLTGSVLFLIPLISLARSSEARDLLSKCLLFSLLLHVGLTMGLSAISVGKEVIQYVREEAPVEVPIDLQAARVAELQAQVRNQITDAGEGLGGGESLIDGADAGTRGGVMDVVVEPPRPVSVQVPQTLVKPVPLALEADAPRVRPTPVAERMAQADPEVLSPPPMEIFLPQPAPPAPAAAAAEAPTAAPQAQVARIERPLVTAAPQPVVSGIAPVDRSDPPLSIELPLSREGPAEAETMELRPRAEVSLAPDFELPSAAVAPVSGGEIEIAPPQAPLVQRQDFQSTQAAARGSAQVAVPTVGAGAGRSMAQLGIGAIEPPPAAALADVSPAPLPPTALPEVTLPSTTASAPVADTDDWAVAQITRAPRPSSGRGTGGGVGQGVRPDTPRKDLAPTPIKPIQSVEQWAPELPPAEPPIALIAPTPTVPEVMTPISPVTPAVPVGPTTLKTDALVQRDPEVRSALVEGLGGSKETEAAVARALAYLARNQEPDGRWTRFNTDAAPRRQRPGNYDMALTGLASLAFLAADHTPAKPGPYQQTVKRALDLLVREQRDNGDLRGHLGGDLYDHSIATIALAEAAVMTGNPVYQRSATKGIEFLINARNKATGGWRYAPGDPADTSVTGWAVMAFHSARNMGYTVPEDAIRDARRWIDAASSGPTRIRTAYQLDEAPTDTMTAQGVFTRILLGQKLTEAQIAEATDFITRRRPSTREPNYYHWYYVTMTLMQFQGPAWTQWNADITRHLATTQRRGGAADGSWDSDGLRNDPGGRVYATAMAALTLEVYYRYLPLYSPTRNHP